MTDNYRVHQEARAAIWRLVKDTGGEMVTRPVIRSDPQGAVTNEPEPLAGITAARHLEWAMRDEIRRHVKAAREDGRTWAEIGAALGCRTGPDRLPVSESAFRVVAADLGSGPSFAWTCPACLKTVIDYGPEAGHPEDAERGHAGGCARFAETVAEWDKQREEGEDG